MFARALIRPRHAISHPSPRRAGRTGVAMLTMLCALVTAIPAARAQAQADTPATSAADCAAPLTDLASALSRETQCWRDAGFLYALGVALLDAGRYHEAADRLEGAILRNPQHWPAQLAYADALLAVGDREAALALRQSLATDPAVPPALRAQAAGAEPTPPLLATQSRHTLLALAGGVDDNLLGVTRFSEIPITLPEGSLSLTLADDQRPQRGSFHRLDIGHEASLLGADGARWSYSGVLSQRWSPSLTAADYRHGALVVERSAAEGDGPVAQALVQQLERDGDTALRQWQLGAGWEWASLSAELPCTLRLAAEWQHNRYPASPHFDGQYRGGRVQASCADTGWSASLRSGRDQPQSSSRPGGEQQQVEVRLQKRTPLGPGQLDAEVAHYWQNDAEGYSPLLENNLARHLRRTTWRLEYRWPTEWGEPYLSVQWLDQSSTLPLFAVRNQVATLGLRKAW